MLKPRVDDATTPQISILGGTRHANKTSFWGHDHAKRHSWGDATFQVSLFTREGAREVDFAKGDMYIHDMVKTKVCA